jgi:Cu+-exporting ATPase
VTSSAQIVETYLNALYGGDPQVRGMLTDDFHFTGPAAHLHGADAYLKAAGHAAAGTRSIEIESILANGDEAAAFYVLHLDHAVDQARVAEHFHLTGGRIAASTLIMDTAPFLPRARAAAPQEFAVDPVCGMQVDKASPAATRTHGGITYYFCSTGCAEAFEKAPQEYLSA